MAGFGPRDHAGRRDRDPHRGRVRPPALVAIYTVASRRPWRIAVAGAVVAVLGLALHRLAWGYSLPLFGVIAGAALAGAALALGRYQATRLAS